MIKKLLAFVLFASTVTLVGCNPPTENIDTINDQGKQVMQLEIQGHNRAFNPIRFEYKVEWLDNAGLTIDSATSKWLTWSAAAKAPFTIKAVAPRTTAVDFRMNTRKIPN